MRKFLYLVLLCISLVYCRGNLKSKEEENQQVFNYYSIQNNLFDSLFIKNDSFENFLNRRKWFNINANVTDKDGFYGFEKTRPSIIKDTILINLISDRPSFFHKLKIKLYKKEYYTSYELIYPVDGVSNYYIPQHVKLIFKNDPFNIEGEIKGYIEFELKETHSKFKGYFKCNLEK